uniref:PH domain-containing protein n=1 Tax=Gongylonema pulchrum TaxID=637853 RepID=A0A183D6C1_9BILA
LNSEEARERLRQYQDFQERIRQHREPVNRDKTMAPTARQSVAQRSLENSLNRPQPQHSNPAPAPDRERFSNAEVKLLYFFRIYADY